MRQRSFFWGKNKMEAAGGEEAAGEASNENFAEKPAAPSAAAKFGPAEKSGHGLFAPFWSAGSRGTTAAAVTADCPEP